MLQLLCMPGQHYHANIQPFLFCHVQNGRVVTFFQVNTARNRSNISRRYPDQRCHPTSLQITLCMTSTSRPVQHRQWRSPCLLAVSPGCSAVSQDISAVSPGSSEVSSSCSAVSSSCSAVSPGFSAVSPCCSAEGAEHFSNQHRIFFFFFSKRHIFSVRTLNNAKLLILKWTIRTDFFLIETEVT